MKLAATLLGGVVFGVGMAVSTMTHQEVVLSFLQLVDLGLLLVMAGAVAVTALAFTLAPRLLRRPTLGGAFHPVRTALDRRTVLGAACFGLGWGLSGLCPGSAVASLGTGNLPVLFGLSGMFVGAYVEGRRFGPGR